MKYLNIILIKFCPSYNCDYILQFVFTCRRMIDLLIFIHVVKLHSLIKKYESFILSNIFF